jgi:hypothetical protein
MHVHRNDGLLKSRLQVSIIFFAASLTCLLGGFIVSTRLNDISMQYAVSLSTLGFGMLLWWQNKIYLTRWGPKSQQDAALARGLKGVDSRYHLFAFPSSRLPDYILAGPMGLLVLLPRTVTGTVSCNDGRWSHDEGTPLLVRLTLIMSPRPTLGNPEKDAASGVADLRRFLTSKLGAETAERIPIEPILVLMDPHVKLESHGCATPGLYVRNLRSHVRREPRVLQNNELDGLVEALSAA